MPGEPAPQFETRTDLTTPDAPRVLGRDQALDMVKGLLVVAMLIIHASNLFVDTPAIKWLVYPTLLGFVSGSWLCISGYIIGLRYRLEFSEDSRAVSRRLFGRGWRLVAIFAGSNVLLGNMHLASCFGFGQTGACDLTQIFVYGDDGQAFEVLLGIGYLLLIAPACLWLPTRLITGATLCLVVGLSVLDGAGVKLSLLSWMLACGIAGIVIGTAVSPGHLRNVLENSRGKILTASLALIIWTVTEALFLFSPVSSISPAFYVPHVVSALWMLYVAGAWMAGVGWLSRPLTIMAHYSLLAYMGQMAILRTWYYAASDWPVASHFSVSFVVTFCTLMTGLYVLSALRSRFAGVDRLYSSVFG